MRVLLVSPEGDGAWFVWLLGQTHDVDWVCLKERYRETLQGIIPPPLVHIPDPAKYDLVVFDSSGLGKEADAARAATPTVAASELADQLEHDRMFGLQAMEEAGIRVAAYEPFDDRAAAIKFVQKSGKRYVLKPLDDEGLPKDTTYVAKNADDMVQHIECDMHPKIKSFILQEFVTGTEVSTEAWWNGREFIALNHTLEEKKFMAGGIGPNTGCAGNLLWMPARHNPLFQQGLTKITDFLRDREYVGPIDLNSIVTEGDLYGIEWTPRFGYEGTCNLTRLLPMDFGDFLYAVAVGETPAMAAPKARFAATVQLSVPPYPNCEAVPAKKWPQVPVKGLDLEHLEGFFLRDVMLVDNTLVTCGRYNCIGTPIGISESLGGAFDEVQIAIDRLEVPNLQYRNDIRSAVEKRYTSLQTWGWLRTIG
jgi:phosphoribosylamine-glycine ligase